MTQTLLTSDVDRRLLTVDEFQKMAETGILREDERLELIEGEMVRMPAIGDPHAMALIQLDGVLREQLSNTYYVGVQGPLRLSDQTYVVPDLIIFRKKLDILPPLLRPVNVLLVVEVSDSSLRFDTKTKLPLYARAAIPEVWILDLNGRKASAYRDPAGYAYQSIQEYATSQTLTPHLVRDLSVALSKVLKDL